MTIDYENTTDWYEDGDRQYLEGLSLESWYNRRPVVIYLYALVLVGTVGNVLSFLVYYLRFPESSTRVFVLTMSTCDLLTNVLGLPLQILTIRHAYDSYDVTLCRCLYVFATIPTQASGFYLVLVAYDRYQRICKPFENPLGARQAWKLVAASTVVATVLFIPFTPFYGYHTLDSPRPGVKAVMCWVHDPFRDTIYPLAYLTVVGASFCCGLLLMTVFYFRIAVTVFRRRRSVNFKQSRRKSSQHTRSPLADVKVAACDLKEGQDGVSANFKTSEIDCSETVSSLEVSCSQSNQVIQQPSCCLENWNRPDTSEPGEKVTTGSTPGGSSEVLSRSVSTGEEISPLKGKRVLIRPARPQSRTVQSTPSPNAPKSWNKRHFRSRTTFMMAVLTAFYIANWLPHFAMRIMSNDPANLCKSFTRCGLNLYGLFMRSYFLSSAVNAFIYSFCNPRFRRQCYLLFKRGMRRKW